MKLLHDCFTGADNETYDLGRLLTALACVAYIFFGALTLSRFEPLAFAGGFTAIFTGGGIMRKLTENTESKK